MRFASVFYPGDPNIPEPSPLFFQSNTRSSTIIGIVGAGGIGQHFSEQIMVLEWQHVAFLVLLILITVAVINSISARLRQAIIGASAERVR